MSKVPRDIAAGFAELSQKYYLELQKALKLLKVAKCPNAHCVDGTCQRGFDDDYEVFECQFCHERKALLGTSECPQCG